jgi:hypothetical protein
MSAYIRIFSKLQFYKEKNPIFMNLLKKLMKIFPKKSILYKTAGIICEFTGNFKTALKFYLIFLNVETLDFEFSSRYTILKFWYGTKYFINYGLLKSIIKYNLFHLEITSFEAKLLEQNNYIKQAIQVRKNFIYKNYIILNFKVQKNMRWNLNAFYIMLWLRNMKKCFNLNPYTFELLKNICYYYKNLKNNLKLSYIIIQLIIYLYFRLNAKFKIQRSINIFIDLVINFKQPYFLKAFSKIPIPLIDNQAFISDTDFASIFIIYIKWFKLFGVGLSNNFFFSLMKEKNILDCVFKSYGSYNFFSRIPNIKLSLLLEIARVKKMNGFILESLDIYKNIIREWPENLEPINTVSKIYKKILKKKKKLRFILKEFKKKLKKMLNITKKRNIKSDTLKNLINKAEEFFENRKFMGFSQLILSLIYTYVCKPVDFCRYNTLSTRKYVKLQTLDLKDKCIIKKLPYKLESLIYKYSSLNANFAFLFSNRLIRIIFTLIFNNNLMLVDKKFSFLILNRIFFRKATRELKLFLLLLTLKKKKYKKAYEYSRTICLENPNSLVSWSILSKIEKQVGLAVSKTLRFSLRLLKRYPNSTPAIIFTANHCSLFASYGYALAEYLQAYQWKKDSSFLNFCISLQYLHKSISRRNLHSEYTIVISLCFFFNYKLIRFLMAEAYLKRSKKSILLRKEVFFNKARLYLFLDLKNLALLTFKSVLKQVNQTLTINKRSRRVLSHLSYDLKNDSLINIHLLYLNSGNKILNNQIKQKLNI